MFAIIKNAQSVSKETAVISYSKLKMKILEVFLKEKFIKEINRKGKKNKKIIEIVLAYDENGKKRVNNIRRISKQSKRVYLRAKDVKPDRSCLTIITTPKGVMSAKEAKNQNVGGEIICKATT